MLEEIQIRSQTNRLQLLPVLFKGVPEDYPEDET